MFRNFVAPWPRSFNTNSPSFIKIRLNMTEKFDNNQAKAAVQRRRVMTAQPVNPSPLLPLVTAELMNIWQDIRKAIKAQQC